MQEITALLNEANRSLGNEEGREWVNGLLRWFGLWQLRFYLTTQLCVQRMSVGLGWQLTDDVNYVNGFLCGQGDCDFHVSPLDI